MKLAKLTEEEEIEQDRNRRDNFYIPRIHTLLAPRNQEKNDKEIDQVNQIITFLQNTTAEDLLSDMIYRADIRDSDFTDHYLTKAIQFKAYAQNIPINQDRWHHPDVKEEMTSLIKEFNKLSRQRPINLQEHLMFAVMSHLYEEGTKKIVKNAKFYPSRAREELQRIHKKAQKAYNIISQLEFDYDLEDHKTRETFLISFPYISAIYKQDKIVFYDDLLLVEIPFNKKDFNPFIFNRLMEAVNSRFLADLGPSLTRNNLFSIEWFHCYKKENRQYIDVGLDISNYLTKETVTFPLKYNMETHMIERLTGEEIKESEVITHEALTQMAEGEEAQAMQINGVVMSKETMEKRKQSAYNMFLSTLSDAQRKMYNDLNVVLLEGDNYYYLVTDESFNYLVRFKKNLDELKIGDLETFESLCIHPDPEVPFYDGIAAIHLNLLSGNEDYVNQKSNSFIPNRQSMAKVNKFFDKLMDYGLNFNGLETLDYLY